MDQDDSHHNHIPLAPPLSTTNSNPKSPSSSSSAHSEEDIVDSERRAERSNHTLNDGEGVGEAGEVGGNEKSAAGGGGVAAGAVGASAGGSPGPRPRKYGQNFFDPEMAGLRKVALKIMGPFLVLTILVMWATLPLFWGSFDKALDYSSHLSIAIIDLDTPLSSSLPNSNLPTLGQWITQAGLNNSERLTTGGSSVGTLGFYSMDSDEATNSYSTMEEIIHAVHQDAFWGAVVINSSITGRLYNARRNGDASWDPTAAVHLVYNQARNENAANFIVSIGGMVLNRALSTWGAASAGDYLRSNAGNQTAITALYSAPQTISPGVAYTAVNIRQFELIAQAPNLVGQIFLLVFAFLVAMTFNAVRDIISPFLKTRSYILLRIAVPAICYFFLSLFLAMINLPFKLPFGAHFTYGAGFMTWWMLLFCGMLACGYALEFFITILTPRFVAYSLAVLIIVQVSVVSLPRELQRGLYSYGYAAPYNRISNGLRTICFDTKSELGMDFGIVIAWAVLSGLITMPLITFLYHEKARKAHERAEREKVSAN